MLMARCNVTLGDLSSVVNRLRCTIRYKTSYLGGGVLGWQKWFRFDSPPAFYPSPPPPSKLVLDHSKIREQQEIVNLSCTFSIPPTLQSKPVLWSQQANDYAKESTQSTATTSQYRKIQWNSNKVILLCNIGIIPVVCLSRLTSLHFTLTLSLCNCVWLSPT